MTDAAAFFDLDKTLMSGSSGYFWARAAAGAGLMSRRQLASDAISNLVYRLKGSTDESTAKVRARVGAALTGQRVRDFERLGPTVMAGVLPRLYPEVLQIAWEHQDSGRRVYIATAATQGTADLVAHVLGFDGALGSLLEEQDGYYTGRFAGPMAYREGKAERVRELAAAEGIDLAASYAYSDSESDLPMLEAVGHPVVVNPDAPLLRIARERGWEVVVLDRLRGRLRALGVLSAAAILGTAGRTVVRSRGPQAGAAIGRAAAGASRTASRAATSARGSASRGPRR